MMGLEHGPESCALQLCYWAASNPLPLVCTLYTWTNE